MRRGTGTWVQQPYASVATERGGVAAIGKALRGTRNTLATTIDALRRRLVRAVFSGRVTRGPPSSARSGRECHYTIGKVPRSAIVKRFIERVGGIPWSRSGGGDFRG